MTVISYIGLGSNLGAPENQLKTAILHLAKLPNTQITRISSFYHNPAIGPPQPDMINAMVEIQTTLPALALFHALQTIEDQQLRVRTQHWGPRTIDLDMILYGNEIIDSPELHIPHPRMLERAFVLIPLFEIAPNLQLPNGNFLRDYIKDDLYVNFTRFTIDI